MKKRFMGLVLTIALLTTLVFFGCGSTGRGDGTGTSLTIGDSRQLVLSRTPSGDVTWTSSDPSVATVCEKGVVTAVGFSGNAGNRFKAGAATGTATISASGGGIRESFVITATTAPIVDILDLPPMKDQFSEYFMMGNIFVANDARSESGISNENLVYHYNILTAENNMKPDQMARTRGSYNFTTADRMVNAAIASGMKVHGHCLLWHSQIPQWQKDMAGAGRDAALAAMRQYITDVAGHFRGRLHSWDVLNEVFPDGVNQNSDWRTVMRTTGDSQAPNPWYVAIGADFVYEGFLAARRADPTAILYYNDYNTDQLGKMTMIRDMVRDVNERYRREHPNERRLLIEGVGLQEHHNTGTLIPNVKRSIDMLRPLGVVVSISELDVLGQSWSDFRSIGSGNNRDIRSTVTNRGILEQARFYQELMSLYLDNADIIERVSLWGVTDSQSWRSAGLPVLFDFDDRAKPAYYGMISALNNR